MISEIVVIIVIEEGDANSVSPVNGEHFKELSAQILTSTTAAEVMTVPKLSNITCVPPPHQLARKLSRASKPL